MSHDFLNQVTIDYLINPEIYEKCQNISITKMNKSNDKKFYRKRIIGLTKDLLLNRSCVPSPDVEYAFNNYVKACINNFMTIDNNDIIQEDYSEIIKEEAVEKNNGLLNGNEAICNNVNTKLINQQLFNLNNKNNNLNNFVIRKKQTKESELFLPKERNINLKDPTLRKKGVKEKKKKNIDNMYDKEDKKDTQLQ
tara:strand:- start:196 stop:780 length:585 start_codon:yes stop_codon:yes gene_type:complete